MKGRDTTKFDGQYKQSYVCNMNLTEQGYELDHKKKKMLDVTVQIGQGKARERIKIPIEKLNSHPQLNTRSTFSLRSLTQSSKSRGAHLSSLQKA